MNRPLRRHRHRLRRGGRHRRPRARAHRQPGAPARARRLPAREIENWDPKAVWVDGRYRNAVKWTDLDTGQRVHPEAALLRRRQHEVLRGDPVPDARARLRRRAARRRGLPRLAARIRRLRAVLLPRRAALPGARRRAGRTRPTRRRRRTTRTRRSATSRGSRSCAPISPRAGLHPFELPNGILIDETRPQLSACIRCATCDGYPCLANGKADAQVICVDPALRYPNVTLLTGALRHPDRDRARRARRSSGSSSSATDARGVLGRRGRPRRRRDQLARRCCCARPRRGTRRGWATPRAWWAAT